MDLEGWDCSLLIPHCDSHDLKCGVKVCLDLLPHLHCFLTSIHKVGHVFSDGRPPAHHDHDLEKFEFQFFSNPHASFPHTQATIAINFTVRCLSRVRVKRLARGHEDEWYSSKLPLSLVFGSPS